MAPSRDQVTASEAPIAVHRSQEYVQIWLLSAVSTILSKRKLLPQRCFKTVTLQTSPGRLTYENFLQSTAASAPTNGGTKLIVLDQHSGERADGLFQLLTKSIFPALREKSLVAFQLYLTEDPRAYTKAIEAYTICVTHDGLPDINIRHTPTAAPPVATVFNDLAKSLREYEKFLTNLPPLPRDRFGFITTWHTQTASTAPIGMFAAPAEPHLWPVKQGWKADTFLPEAVRVGAEEYHTVGLGAVCMKPTSGLNKKPIRSVSDTELAYDDAETYGQEFLVFDAETSTTKDHFPLAVSSFVSRDLDVPPESPSQHPPRRGAKPVNTQNSTISVGDQRRKSELQRLTPGRISPIQQDTQFRVYDTCVSDVGNEHVATNPAQGTPDRGPVDQEQHETIRCLCRFEREEGNMVPCKECKTWQHGHCSGYYDLHAIPAAGEHRCATCQAPRSDVDRERWLEQCETYAFIRRVLFLLRNAEFVAHKHLCKLMAVEDNIVADVLHRLQDENFVEARQAKRQPAAYRLTQDDIRIEAMRREYFKVPSRRIGTHGSATQAQSKEVPTTPRTSRALFETPSRRDSRRKRANTNDGRDSDESTKRRAINDGRDVRETPLLERTVLLQQTPRRSPRIAGMLLRKEFASFQCEKVFQLSEDFETPPSSAVRGGRH